jgi:hypothetical protein
MTALWIIAAMEVLQFIWYVKRDRDRAVLEYNAGTLRHNNRMLEQEKERLNTALTAAYDQIAKMLKEKP